MTGLYQKKKKKEKLECDQGTRKGKFVVSKFQLGYHRVTACINPWHMFLEKYVLIYNMGSASSQICCSSWAEQVFRLWNFQRYLQLCDLTVVDLIANFSSSHSWSWALRLDAGSHAPPQAVYIVKTLIFNSVIMRALKLIALLPSFLPHWTLRILETIHHPGLTNHF